MHIIALIVTYLQTLCFLAFKSTFQGSTRPLKSAGISHLAPYASTVRTSIVITLESLPSVWMLIQQTLCRMSFIFRSAQAFLCFSDIPLTLPHHEVFALIACFYIARAPTVNKGGLGLPFSSSGVKIVQSLLKLQSICY